MCCIAVFLSWLAVDKGRKTCHNTQEVKRERKEKKTE